MTAIQPRDRALRTASGFGAQHSLLAFALALSACAAPGPVPPAWLPTDGKPVPAAVQSRAPLPFCGVAVGEQDVRDATGCALTALQRGQPAEVVLAPDGPAGALLTIVRVFPEGPGELIWRSAPDGLPPLWEIEHCAAVADGVDDERDGTRIGVLLLRGCAPLVRLDG